MSFLFFTLRASFIHGCAPKQRDWHDAGLSLLGGVSTLFKTDTLNGTRSLRQLESMACERHKSKMHTCTNSMVSGTNIFQMACHSSIQLVIVLSHAWQHLHAGQR